MLICVYFEEEGGKGRGWVCHWVFSREYPPTPAHLELLGREGGLPLILDEYLPTQNRRNQIPAV